MRKLTVLMLSIALSLGQLLAQQSKTITGKVTDDKRNGVPKASITVKGFKTGTTSSDDGSFSLEVNPAAKIIIISAVGYKEKEISILDKTFIEVALNTIDKNLGDVVVTALGITKDKRSLGYATTNVKGEEFVKVRETNIFNSLAGRVAGVRINSQSGTLGGSVKVILRGVTSLDGDNQPLFVIDGFPITNSNSTGGTTKNNVDYGNRVGDLSPDDIESMNILKGATATALYGSRAKNGAIIITTKRGKKGKAAISFNSSVRVDNVLKLPKFQNQYAQGNYGVYDLKFSNGWGPKISDVSNLKFKDFNGDMVTLKAMPNNVADFFQAGISHINNISVSGGNENSDYRVSMSALNETGVIPQSKLERYNIGFNGGKDFSSKLSSRFGFSYITTKALGRPSQSSNNSNIITSAIYGLPRVVDIHKVEDNYKDPITGQQVFLTTDKTGNNPYWIINYNTNNNKVDRFVGNNVITYKPLNWLTITDNLGADIYTEYRNSVIRKGTAGFANGEFTNTEIYSKNFNNDLIVTAEKDIDKDWNLKLSLGHNINEREARSTQINAQNLTIDQLYAYANASTKNITQTYTKRRLLGVFGDLGVSYQNLAFINITGRNDWFSTLPIENRSYFYPSITGSFLFSELLKNTPWLNYAKIRGGVSSVGSDLDPYSLDFQYTPTTSIFLQYISSQANTFPFGNIQTAFTGPRVLPNNKLQPQQHISYEIGVEGKMFDNRVGLDITLYKSNTKRQLISLDVPASTGYFAQTVNAGNIEGKGIEIDLNLVPIRTKNFIWSIDLNFAKNKQTIKSLSEGLKNYSLASGWSGLQIKAEVGKTFGLYGTGWLRDDQGNIVIDAASGLRKTKTDVRFGDIYPAWTGGINNSFSYKGFNFSFSIDIRKGGVFYSGTVANLRTAGLAEETLENREKTFIDKGVVFDGTKYIPNTIPVQSMQDFWASYSATGNTEGNIFDASFVKLRRVQVSYALPSSIFKGYIKGLEFGIEASNLWIIKDYVPHVDPELNFFGSGSIGEGVEFNSIPSTRSLGVNLKATF